MNWRSIVLYRVSRDIATTASPLVKSITGLQVERVSSCTAEGLCLPAAGVREQYIKLQVAMNVITICFLVILILASKQNDLLWRYRPREWLSYEIYLSDSALKMNIKYHTRKQTNERHRRNEKQIFPTLKVGAQYSIVLGSNSFNSETGNESKTTKLIASIIGLTNFLLWLHARVDLFRFWRRS